MPNGKVNIISSLLQIRNTKLPKALRKVEKLLPINELELLKATIAQYEMNSSIESLTNIINLYVDIWQELFSNDIV